MRSKIIEIIESKYDPDVETLEAGTIADDILTMFKKFILWLHDPKSPFDSVFNGIDKTKPRISYRKGNLDKEYSIDEVFKWYVDNVE
jgi:hypothetical protein